MPHESSKPTETPSRPIGTPARGLPEAAALLRGPSPRPTSASDPPHDSIHKLFVEITTECNLDCGMCMRHVWQEPAARMSAQTFALLVEQAAECGTRPTVNLSGFGEPTIHPRFADFLRGVKAAGLPAEVVTNAVAIDEQMAGLLVDWGGCDLRETNDEDCFGNEFPCCGECLWAAGPVQCP